MDISDLEAIGLSRSQAEVYAFLIKNGSTKPSLLAQKLRLTRTNAYKILDSLVELRLIIKETEGKTLSYKPDNPLALASLTGRYRAEAVSREEKVNQIMHDLLEIYGKHTSKPGVEVFSGRDEVMQAYRKQINLREDIKFIWTRTDVPMMGYDVMSDIRTSPARNGNTRKSIMAAPDNRVINPKNYKRSNMKVTWIELGRYKEPVEWSVTKSSLLIVSYTSEPQAILIIDTVMSAAFSQVFDMLTHYLAKEPIHKEMDAIVTKAQQE